MLYLVTMTEIMLSAIDHVFPDAVPGTLPGSNYRMNGRRGNGGAELPSSTVVEANCLFEALRFGAALNALRNEDDATRLRPIGAVEQPTRKTTTHVRQTYIGD